MITIQGSAIIILMGLALATGFAIGFAISMAIIDGTDDRLR